MNKYPPVEPGNRYGRLIVNDKPAVDQKYECLCNCGKVCWVRSDRLKAGNTKSCGCLQRDRVSGSTLLKNRSSKEYKTWARIIQRCHNPSNKRYHDYGGRGIKVDARWRHSFNQFYIDMGDAPSVTSSIDRIDNDGDYEPNNCCWSDTVNQSRNRRDNVNLTAFGETKCATDWTKDSRCKVSTDTLARRVAKGWLHEVAITQPAWQR